MTMTKLIVITFRHCHPRAGEDPCFEEFEREDRERGLSAGVYAESYRSADNDRN